MLVLFQDFQIVREKHDRDNYRKLKRTIMTKINWDRGRRGTVRTLQSSLLPLLAVGIHHGSASNLAIHRASFASRRGSHVQVVDARDRRRIYPRHKGGSSSEEAEISVDIEDNSNSPRGSLRGSHPDIHKQLRENSIPSIPEEEECSSPSPSTKVDAVAAEEDGLAIRKRRAPHIYLTIQPPSEEDLHALTEEGSAKDSTDVVWHQGSPRSPDSGCGNTDSPSSLTPSPSFRSRSPHRTPPLVRQARSTSPPSFIMKNGYGNSLAVPSSSGRDGSPASQRSTISEDSGRGESNQSREHLLHITCLWCQKHRWCSWSPVTHRSRKITMMFISALLFQRKHSPFYI